MEAGVSVIVLGAAPEEPTKTAVSQSDDVPHGGWNGAGGGGGGGGGGR